MEHLYLYFFVFVTFFLKLYSQSDRDNKTTTTATRQSPKDQLDQVGLRCLDCDAVAADEQITTALHTQSMTTSLLSAAAATHRFHLKRNRRTSDESARAAQTTETADVNHTNKTDDFYATNANTAAHDALQSVVTSQQRPSAIVNNYDDRSTAAATTATMKNSMHML